MSVLAPDGAIAYAIASVDATLHGRPGRLMFNSLPGLTPATAGACVVLVYTHPSCLRHDPGPGHPECPARLAVVLEALQQSDLPDLSWHEAPRASREQLQRVHARDHVARILDVAPGQARRLDPDTAMSPDSAEAALRAAGAGCAAIDALLRQDDRIAFCAVRPPGHHATATSAMGFCLFNSIAVAAAHAQAAHGLERIAIVDFDVHHGNGSQDICWDQPHLLYLSSHQWPLYPGTGDTDERGGSGNVGNVPLPAGADGRAFRAAWSQTLLPALRAFRPQLILASAGFDAHRLDPLAGLNLEADDYTWIGAELRAVAQDEAQGRVVAMLEGGYSLTALRESCVAFLHGLIRG